MSQFGYSRKCRVGQCYVMCRSTFSLFSYVRHVVWVTCDSTLLLTFPRRGEGPCRQESHMVLTDALVDGLGSRVARSRALIRLVSSVVDGVPVGSSPA